MTEGSEQQRPASDPGGGAAAAARLRYRLLTGTDDRAFCERISAALADGYVLHGNPVMASRDGDLVVGQAVVLPAPE